MWLLAVVPWLIFLFLVLDCWLETTYEFPTQIWNNLKDTKAGIAIVCGRDFIETPSIWRQWLTNLFWNAVFVNLTRNASALHWKQFIIYARKATSFRGPLICIRYYIAENMAQTCYLEVFFPAVTQTSQSSFPLHVFEATEFSRTHQVMCFYVKTNSCFGNQLIRVFTWKMIRREIREILHLFVT